MQVEDILANAGDQATVRRVFGDPYEKDGVTFIPVARVSGGGGGGSGSDDGAEGGGGGYGVNARPVGAYVIEGGSVSWIPALDTTRIAIAGQVIAIVALLVIRSILTSKRRR
ncbi:MAG: sporulation protein [Actinobacteria bacterium]|nr:sporulation protein [Actinomycetota bacterium]MBU1866039.1 sporulation protein [Actinomycetota bacterium]